MASTSAPRARRFRRLKRALLALGLASVIGVGALWIAVNRVPWFGAWLADTLRAVIGTEAVARLEEIAYDLQDRWERIWRSGEAPKQYWETPPAPAGSSGGAAPPPAPAASGSASEPGRAPLPPLRPADVGPLFPRVSAPGDGVWVPVELPGRPGEPPRMWKTLIHPDRERPWAELFVVALDLRRARLRAVAGSEEPRATVPEARSYVRPGLIPVQERGAAFAAWNGGFKEEHGHYGMKIDGVTLVKPRPWACTIAAWGDGSLQIGEWKKLAEREAEMAWWRQTPPCLVADGKLHPALSDENTGWGAAIGGDTVVRRSALGLDRERAFLYMAVTNATSARAIAAGMKHAGGSDVAQLDINYSYPRLVLLSRAASGEIEASGVFPGFAFEKDDYTGRPSPRDFFYVVDPEEAR